MKTGHLTEEQLQDLAAGGSNGGEHLAVCPACRERASATRALDHALRVLPLERTRAGFTASVMHELGLAPGARSGMGIVEWLAAFVALILVVGTLVTVFTFTGVIDADRAVAVPGGFLERAGGGLSAGIDAVSGWLGEITPGIGASRSVQVTLMMLTALGGIGLADRYLFRRLRPQGRR